MQTPISYDTKALGDKMKIEVAADQIAAFQAAMEKAYAAKGCKYPSVLTTIVANFASSVIYANGLIPEMEDSDSEA